MPGKSTFCLKALFFFWFVFKSFFFFFSKKKMVCLEEKILDLEICVSSFVKGEMSKLSKIVYKASRLLGASVLQETYSCI